MNRGSGDPLPPPFLGSNSFNEAPIHESGKSRHPVCYKTICLASMRPRFMNRGSQSMFRMTLDSWLSFNEAPIHESGKCQDDDTADSSRKRLQ